MSHRRKSGLSPKHLKALEHLGDVLEALEALQTQHAKVRALMGPAPFVRDPAGDVPVPGGGTLQRYVSGPIVDASPPKSATLDTPERREYEEAKRAGREVPPDMRNVSDAQRDRMAEQKALIQAERRAKGLPPSGAAPEPVTEDQIVRTEELPASESGSVGGEEDPEVH